MVLVEVCGDLTLLCAGGSLLLYNHSTSESRLIDVFSEANVNNTNRTDGSDGKLDGSDERTNGRTGTAESEKEKSCKGIIDKKDIEACIDDLQVEEDRGSGETDGRDNQEADCGGSEANGDDGTEKIDDRPPSKNNNNNRDEDGQSIAAAKFSPDGQWLVVGCGWKAVEVWSTVDWKRKIAYSVAKKPTALVVQESSVFVADKAGDVYQFPLPPCSTSTSASSSTTKEELKPILGHLSMLLDVTTTPDSRFIITCDRDEKIRVSHLSRPYEIHTFCLGHREFVTKVAALSSQPPRLLSCSGDGFLRLWNYDDGRCLSELDLSSFSSLFLLPPEPVEEREGGSGGERDCSTPPPLSTTPTNPPVPAVKGFAVISTSTSKHLVAALVDRARAVVLCQVEEDNTIRHLSTTELTEEPLTAAWRRGGRSGGGGAEAEQLVLVVDSSSGDGGAVVLMERDGVELKKVEEVEDGSGLVHLGKLHSHWLRGSSSVSLTHLYKQRYDNVSRYLQKKKERLEVEEAFHQGRGPPPPKKGRWLK